MRHDLGARGADLEDRRPRSQLGEAGAQGLRALGGEGTGGRAGEVILGDDWVAPPGRAGGRRARTRLLGLVTLQRSPLARKIVTFNLIALILLVMGMLWLTPSRDSLALQRARSLANEADLMARVVEARLPAGIAVDLSEGLGAGPAATFAELELRDGGEAFLFDAKGRLVAVAQSRDDGDAPGAAEGVGSSPLGDLLDSAWDALAGLVTSDEPPEAAAPGLAIPRELVAGALDGRAVLNSETDPEGRSIFTVAAPVQQGGRTFGVVAVRSATGEIDALVRSEREQVLRMFIVAVLVSVGLSLVLASTIANPLSDLAAAAESGRDPNARNMSPSRVRIPDLSARPDEIGRLSAALRGMVAALYERIEANEQFAADVAHEIKNPLASLRSAVGSFPFAKRDDQRQKLLDIIEHDVRRLDRLVSDISNASRLDSELVKEEEKSFDLLRMLGGLEEFLGEEARAKGIDFITDLPGQPIVVSGLEGRLAQVFVNLISNAISFCEEGDAIRLWARRRDNRVLVVVEDTGPGIPEDALTKIFQRFYSERPEGQFGNNSGLGLAISKQIVEAHGGVVWAENIRPTEADPTSEPLGARFVVGLPV
ncbi:Sensor histidine kinase ChvG [Rubellimicrobium mesophilum DSM 19309]|uniref:histidine kinase n=1 Tax=Rubellimicrobium mesophilum DSM 19309 TaxID=442562 RepID=A0A017HJR2_9RHOB|nr:sensor histidine kinase [Rubellimicrobium mesophilum]EYD74535.1 Sensor histidine kinase ChvG [Rubellimicrobium mesophilum DSM 19309]